METMKKTNNECSCTVREKCSECMENKFLQEKATDRVYSIREEEIISRWEKKAAELFKTQKNATEKWGRSYFRLSTKLKYDIGEEVYYAWNGIVYKCVIMSILPSGMCWTKTIAYNDNDSRILVDMDRMYKNVSWAIEHAEYQRIMQNIDIPDNEMPKLE